MKRSRKKRKGKITLLLMIKWFFITLACIILIMAIVARAVHYFSTHFK